LQLVYTWLRCRGKDSNAIIAHLGVVARIIHICMVPNSSRCWDGGYQTEMFPIFARHFHKDYFETRHDSFLRNTVHNSRFSFGLSSCSSLISTGLNFYLSRDSDFRNKCFEEQKKVVCLFVCLLACSQLDVCLLLGWKYSCQVMLISKDVTSCCKDQT